MGAKSSKDINDVEAGLATLSVESDSNTAFDQASDLLIKKGPCVKVDTTETVLALDNAGPAAPTKTEHQPLSPEQAFANWKSNQFAEKLGVTTSQVSQVLAELGHSLEPVEDQADHRAAGCRLEHRVPRAGPGGFPAVRPLKGLNKCCQVLEDLKCPSGEVKRFVDPDHTHDCKAWSDIFVPKVEAYESRRPVVKDKSRPVKNKRSVVKSPSGPVKKPYKSFNPPKRYCDRDRAGQGTRRACVLRHVCGGLGEARCVAADNRPVDTCNRNRLGRTSIIEHKYWPGFTENLEEKALRDGNRIGLTVKITDSGKREVTEKVWRRTRDPVKKVEKEEDKIDWSKPRKVPGGPDVDCLCKKRILAQVDCAVDTAREAVDDQGEKVVKKKPLKPRSSPCGLPSPVDSDDSSLGPDKQLIAYREAVERSLRNALGLNDNPAKSIEEQREKEKHLDKATEDFLFIEFDKKKPVRLYPNLGAVEKDMDKI